MGCRSSASKYVMNVFPPMFERIDKLTFTNRSNLTTCSIAESNQSNLSNSKTSWNSTITLGGCFRHYLLVRCSKQAIARKGPGVCTCHSSYSTLVTHQTRLGLKKTDMFNASFHSYLCIQLSQCLSCLRCSASATVFLECDLYRIMHCT